MLLTWSFPQVDASLHCGTSYDTVIIFVVIIISCDVATIIGGRAFLIIRGGIS